AEGGDHPNRLGEFGERPDSSRHLNQLQRAVLGGLRGDRRRSPTWRATSIRGGMLVFLDRLWPEHGVFLRSLHRIELPHDRLVDSVRALEHSSGVVWIPAPGQI